MGIFLLLNIFNHKMENQKNDKVTIELNKITNFSTFNYDK